MSLFPCRTRSEVVRLLSVRRGHFDLKLGHHGVSCSMLAEIVLRKIILRSPEEKADLKLSWLRPDEEFFASGACHVLAAAFLEVYPSAGFSPWSVRPTDGGRGAHVIVMRGDLVFDWAGYSHRDTFLSEYVEAIRVLIPNWNAELLPIAVNPISWEFCVATSSRHPSQFPHDPLPRAMAFVRRFPHPQMPANATNRPSGPLRS